MCTTQTYFDAVEAFEHAAELLVNADPVMLLPQEQLECLRRVETAARKVPPAQHNLVQVAHEQGLAYQLDYTGLKELLVDQLRLAGTEARDRIAGARNRAVEHLPNGLGTPRFALTMAAQREGAISERHAQAVEQVFRKCTRNFGDPSILEDILVSAAREVSPDDLARIGRRAIELIDPDGAEPNDERARRARGLEIGRQDSDLVSEFGGALTAEARALLDVVLEKLGRPGVNNPDDPSAPADDSPAAIAEAARHDRRTQSQRNHDALVAALRIAVTSGELGAHRGLPCIPIITMSIDQVEAELGVATTATGGRISIPDALRMVGTNPRYLLLLDLAERPLFLGREKRLATADQRIALYGSERGCTAPGCDAPATRTQVHHVTEWIDGGKTDITSLTLACDAHHGKVTPGSRGMETITIPRGTYLGRTGWRRKADPTGQAKINHSHHPTELFRQALDRWHRRRAQFREHWRRELLRDRFRDQVGGIFSDIDAILDGPHGPPMLEDLLAQHDADDCWPEAVSQSSRGVA